MKIQDAVSRDSVQQKWPSHLVIVRHGQSKRNAEKEAAKQAEEDSFGTGLRDMDTALTSLGHRQAQAAGEHLAKKYRFCTRIRRDPHFRPLSEER
jgi:broad specificity phosphatase PhoE